MRNFFVYVLICFLLCNSVLADFEEVVSGETEIPLEEVDEVVSSIPDLVNSATSETASGESASEVSPGGNIIYLLTSPSNNTTSAEDEVISDVRASTADPVLTNVAVTTGLSPVTPNNATGLKAVLLSFIGNYDPPIVQFEYTTNNNYKSYVNEIQPDYVWICSFALIALFIFCLFKLGGALIRV